ncbi:carbohydrate ABC transporter permease, partial [Amphritea sp.]|uniref:carbohydrate ABC transporter permease n=1 Tax=Amphritea sp. TaxID=1872502 RepID=UPI003D0B88AE
MNANTSVNSSDTLTVSSGRPAETRRPPRKRYVFLMSAPALLGLFMFMVLPFLMALGMSFTDQRLLSPNATEWVGLRNYDRLLNVSWLVQEPVSDADNHLQRTAEGELVYPRLRSVLRKNPEYKEFKEFTHWSFGDKRVVLLAKDPSFIQSIINTLLFVILVVPIQCGTALGLALLINQKLRGIFLFRTVFFSPVVTSIVVVSIVWSFLYHKDLGLFNHYLNAMSFGLIGPVDWLGDPDWAMPSIVLMSAWQAAGVQM